jgi:phosphoglucomutase
MMEKMILSASGWRGVFALGGGEEDHTTEISKEHRIISAAAAFVFARYLLDSGKDLVFVGADTRPTGKAVAQIIIPVLVSAGCRVRYAGIIAAPEIMAWTRDAGAGGFIYISASHNPIGHNGIKFGLTDGGILPACENEKLIAKFRELINEERCAEKMEELISRAGAQQLEKIYADAPLAKKEAFAYYKKFCAMTAWTGEMAAAVKAGLARRPLGIVCDFNGSARTVSADREFFSELGIKFESVNSAPGEIVHRIVPEGESLEQCRALLEKAHSRDNSFVLGYMPDCDGDRGNLVIWDDALGTARPLDAQEVFALACVAELSHLVWTGELSCGGNAPVKAAVAVNDPTSLRIDRIAAAFGARVFRAEVGEANVVALARRLREKYIVRILGEGSAGGNITHPSAVRDPINTVCAIVKLLCVRSTAAKKGLFEQWCAFSRHAEKYREDFTLADIIASLPPFVTTGAYEKEAVLQIAEKDHSLLKGRFQKIFLREWEKRKHFFKTQYNVHSWKASAFNGTEERAVTDFKDAGRGGLKICFINSEGLAAASLWMRGSGTEPVFRIMADVEGSEKKLERDMIEWLRQMVVEADKDA